MIFFRNRFMSKISKWRLPQIRLFWEYAKQEGYTIVSKDSDFHQRGFVLGHPPKVIWIQRGNCSTDEIYTIINKNEEAIRLFGENKRSSFLVLE